MSSNDSTLVTGSPFSARAPEKGSVLGERWEVRELEEADAIFLTMRAIDQENDLVVLMRLVAPGLLGDKDARRMAERLGRLVGKGGPSINVLREVDREGATLFAVEAYPTGASFRSVLEARRQKGQTFTAAELLPVVAQLDAALAGIPDPYFHGDLRPQRIFVAPDRVLLTGGFFLPVMPGDPLVDALARDIPLRRQFAPEVADGLAGKPSDRWSVAALVWEALVGAPPQPGPRTVPPKLGALGVVLTRFLDPDPAHRPATLTPLLEALATAAGVAVPASAPETFELEEEDSDETTQHLERRAIGSETLELLGPGTEPGVNDTQKLPALGEDGKKAPKPKRDLEGIDPALLQAAEAGRKVSDSGTFELDAGELQKLDTGGASKKSASGRPLPSASSSSDLDPRLVRAALGVSLSSEDSDAKPAPAARPTAAKKTPGVTQELDASDLETFGASKPAGRKLGAKPNPASAPLERAKPGAPSKPRAAAAAAPKPAAHAAPSAAAAAHAAPSAAAPRASAPAPRPVEAPRVSPAAHPIEAPRASQAPRPAEPAPAGRPSRGAGSAAPIPAAAPRPAPAPSSASVTPVVAQPARVSVRPPVRVPQDPSATTQPAMPAPRRTSTGPSGATIVIGAVVLALVILAAALLYRHAQDTAAHEHRIDERLRELHSGSTTPAP